MPDTKITALTAITTVNPATSPLVIVDLTDTTMAASGTTKKVTANQILGSGGTATLASATITGDLTVRTTGLVVNATGVGVNITPSVRLHASDSDNPANGTLRLGSAGIYGQIKNSASSTGKLEFTSVGTGASGGYNFSIEGQNAHRIEASGVFNWYNGAGGTRMTLDATGLAIGDTAFAGTRLTLRESASQPNALAMTNRNATQTWRIGVDVSAVDDKILGFYDSTSTTFRMQLTDTGNLGIAVTPSAWGSGFRYVQAGPGCAYGTNGSVDRTDLAANWYYNAGDKYINATGKASIFQQSGGAFFWLSTNTTSGGAGSAMTLNTNMTLDASGNLLVGTTSSPAGAKVGAITKLSGVSAEGTASINVSTTPVALSRVTGTSGLFFVMGYNASGGAGGWYLVASTGSGTPTVISSGGTPGLTLTFTMVGGQLNAQTASGTFVANAFSITA